VHVNIVSLLTYLLTYGAMVYSTTFSVGCVEYREKLELQKWSRCLACSRPGTNESQTESTSVFRTTTDMCQISSRSVDIRKKTAAEKPIFDLH